MKTNKNSLSEMATSRQPLIKSQAENTYLAGELTANQLQGVAGGENALVSAFIKGFLAGGGTLGNPTPAPETPWPPAGRGDCNTNHNGVKY